MLQHTAIRAANDGVRTGLSSATACLAAQIATLRPAPALPHRFHVDDATALARTVAHGAAHSAVYTLQSAVRSQAHRGHVLTATDFIRTAATDAAQSTVSRAQALAAALSSTGLPASSLSSSSSLRCSSIALALYLQTQPTRGRSHSPTKQAASAGPASRKTASQKGRKGKKKKRSTSQKALNNFARQLVAVGADDLPVNAELSLPFSEQPELLLTETQWRVLTALEQVWWCLFPCVSACVRLYVRFCLGV